MRFDDLRLMVFISAGQSGTGYRVQGNQHKQGYTENVSSLEKRQELLTLSAVSFPDWYGIHVQV